MITAQETVSINFFEAFKKYWTDLPTGPEPGLGLPDERIQFVDRVGLSIPFKTGRSCLISIYDGGLGDWGPDATGNSSFGPNPARQLDRQPWLMTGQREGERGLELDWKIEMSLIHINCTQEHNGTISVPKSYDLVYDLSLFGAYMVLIYDILDADPENPSTPLQDYITFMPTELRRVQLSAKDKVESAYVAHELIFTGATPLRVTRGIPTSQPITPPLREMNLDIHDPQDYRTWRRG